MELKNTISKNNYIEFDYLKGIGIILVILGHSFSFTGFNLLDKEKYYGYNYIFNYIYSFHMPLFFIIAGFLSNKKYDINKFYISKVKRLLIPYIFINILDSIPRYFFKSLVNNSSNDILRIIFYSGVATWFIYTLFIIFLIFPLLDKYILRKDKYFLFLILLILLNIFDSKIVNINIFTINKVIFYFIYFYLGYMLRNYYLKIIQSRWFNSTVLLTLLYLFSFYAFPEYLKNNGTKIIYPIIGFILSLKISIFLKKYKNIKFLEFCGKNSLIFYLLELFYSVIWRVFLVKVIDIKYHILIVTLFFILKFVSVTISVIIINKIKILSFLFGSKISKERIEYEKI